jgi:hypothetical protein
VTASDGRCRRRAGGGSLAAGSTRALDRSSAGRSTPCRLTGWTLQEHGSTARPSVTELGPELWRVHLAHSDMLPSIHVHWSRAPFGLESPLRASRRPIPALWARSCSWSARRATRQCSTWRMACSRVPKSMSQAKSLMPRERATGGVLRPAGVLCFAASPRQRTGARKRPSSNISRAVTSRLASRRKGLRSAVCPRRTAYDRNGRCHERGWR